MELTDFFDSLWEQTHSVEEAESLFSRALLDEPGLKQEYRAWCAENEVSEKRGFSRYCRERLDEEERRWDVLSDDYSDY